MNNFIVSIIIFAVVVFVIEMLLYAYKTIRNPDSKKIRKRLKTFSYKERKNELPDILQKKVLSDVPLLNKILLRIPGRQYLDRLLQLANAQYPLGAFILLTIFLAITSCCVSFLITRNKVFAIIITLLLGGIPFFYLCLKKKKRIEKFQRQLPDGLELIARSLKAGHAFPSSMKIAADEFDDPLGPEFGETLNEINFGVNVPDALKNLTERINCPDLNFFVISVILQRETGGNLAEIIENIAYIIRERFKLYGKIRTLAAEGKISAIILSSLPFFIMLALYFTSSAYIRILFSDPAGKIIIGIAAFMMVIGILIMKKIVNIKV
ncbi:MAG: type II secretion system F family protein [Desulfobacteraceae bacterium]|nr:type II secretion system F family protein [Desulfobacteraceae bacterium]MBC2719452.1 type II secretion system F family protein [Desulfobacteraceae bacterium]